MIAVLLKATQPAPARQPGDEGVRAAAEAVVRWAESVAKEDGHDTMAVAAVRGDRPRYRVGMELIIDLRAALAAAPGSGAHLKCLSCRDTLTDDEANRGASLCDVCVAVREGKPSPAPEQASAEPEETADDPEPADVPLKLPEPAWSIRPWPAIPERVRLIFDGAVRLAAADFVCESGQTRMPTEAYVAHAAALLDAAGKEAGRG